MPRAGILAGFALLLSMVNTGYDVMLLADRSRPEILPPEQVLLTPDEYGPGQTYLRIAARLSYTNRAASRKSSVVAREWVEYALDGERREQRWQSYEEFEPDEQCGVRSTASKDTHPFVVAGQEATSHVTYFAPRPKATTTDKYHHYFRWEDFVRDLEAQDRVSFYFVAEMLNGKRLYTQCDVVVDEDVRSYARRGCALTLSCA